MTDQPPAPADQARPKRQLTLFDSTCIIWGIILGAGIYRSSPEIAKMVPNVGWLLAVWLAGGLISLIGALCYAELATAYPKEGGDYVYLTRAYGRSVGFLFAWAQLWVIYPGSIGAMAYIFAAYANQLVPLPLGEDEFTALMVYAVASIVGLTAVNILGVSEGKWTQNLLTVIKVVGLIAIIVVGLFVSTADVPADASAQTPAVETEATESEADGAASDTAPDAANGAAEVSSFDYSLLGIAMILVLFTYGGWNDMAYVGAEVRNPEKNIFRALILGTVGVTVIYLLITAAFLNALGLDGLRGSDAVATDVMALAIGPRAGQVISLLICISALGAINGHIFTGARIYYALGTEHRLFSWLGRWSPSRGTPVPSLIIQAVITLTPVVAFAILRVFGLSEGEFESMIYFTSPPFWLFFMLTGISVFVLRLREPGTRRPFRVPGYPLTPILFILSCAYMLYSTIDYGIEKKNVESAWAIVILLVGVGFAVADYFAEPVPAPHEDSDPS